MNKIFYSIAIILLATTACNKDDFVIDQAYEKAEITGVELYNRQMVRADKSAVIDTTKGTVWVTLKPNQDITDLKLAVSSSTGSDITPSMSVGFQDFSSPKNYELVSAGKSVAKTWSITVKNP